MSVLRLFQITLMSFVSMLCLPNNTTPSQPAKLLNFAKLKCFKLKNRGFAQLTLA